MAKESLSKRAWIKDNIVLFYGESLDVKKHQHIALQLVWCTQKKHASCTYQQGVLSGSFIIGSGVEHILQLEEGWVLLIEPTSKLGIHITRLLKNRLALEINDIIEPCCTPCEPIKDPLDFISVLFESLNVECDIDVDTAKVSDKRIVGLLKKMDLCLLGQCQTPANWRASDVAAELFLSESRFLHLFKSQVGVAWRPYLRWRRLKCASNSISQGASATEAAYHAGFSDLAHLSRTFQTMFGLTIAEAKKKFL